MAHIVLEIDGIRHEMVNSRLSGSVCEKCSLYNLCNVVIGTPCFGENTRFRKEYKKHSKKLG